jgi:lipopolysaccharide export system protein LptC
MNLQADASERLAIYRRLQGRNRVVGILRIGVPALGAIILASLIGQIYISSLSNRFGVGRISVTREAVSVEAPEYSGVLEDGTTYRVWAAAAQAAIETTDQIGLTDAALTLTRISGVTMEVNAPVALLDSTREIVTIAGIAYVEDSTGTSGTIHDSVFDYASQTLVGKGAVHIDYADGTTLDGVGMTYDAKGMVWTFSGANVTLPSTPGLQSPEQEPSEDPTP